MRLFLNSPPFLSRFLHPSPFERVRERTRRLKLSAFLCVTSAESTQRGMNDDVRRLLRVELKKRSISSNPKEITHQDSSNATI